MEKQQATKNHTFLMSDSFGNSQEKGTYEVAFRRWLVIELDASRITAIQRFNYDPAGGDTLIRSWRKKYASDIVLTLPVMTEKERQKLKALQKQLEQLEKHLEDAQMKNIALETMIDVAEE